MKGFGILILAIAAAAFLFGFNMETSVASSLGGRVHNIGLMNDRQNVIIFAGVLAIVGAVFVGFGNRTTQATEVTNASTRTCPFCAETIKAEAKICRFCQNSLIPITPHPSLAPTGEETLARLKKEREAELDREKSNKATLVLSARKQAIQDALNNPALLNAYGPEGKTPLMHAIGFGDLNTIRALLAVGARTDQLWSNPDSGHYVSIEKMAEQAGLDWSALVGH